MRTAGVSNTRLRIMSFIETFALKKGYSPTVREIARGLDISSTAVVQHHLKILEREGQIRRDPGIFRSIQLNDKKESNLVPLLGVIAAGEPVPVMNSDAWHNEIHEYIEVPSSIDINKPVFALRVKGRSMIDALIDNGDIVLLESAVEVKEGDIAAIWLRKEQEVTLKKVYYEKEQIRLQPANANMSSIYHKPENVEIQGRLVGVIRTYGK